MGVPEARQTKEAAMRCPADSVSMSWNKSGKWKEMGAKVKVCEGE
jgi:hypothetical protein